MPKASAKSSSKKEYLGIIKSIISASEAKGWEAWLENEDKNHQFGTVHVSKRFGLEEVRGVIELTVVQGRVKSSVQCTSFHNYGLEALFSAVREKLEGDGWIGPENIKKTKPALEYQEMLQTLLRNFDKVVRQIKRRYNNRGTIEIKDEYDVQDLLHAILRGFFGDVRPEEYTPSYAGGSSRIDFLLKREQSLVEVKLASPKLKEKQIGEQLIVDIKRYQSHPDCKSLYCLVYDPNGVIRNPAGLETDLSGTHDKLAVSVLVVP